MTDKERMSAELKGARTERKAIKRFVMNDGNFEDLHGGHVDLALTNVEVALSRVVAFICDRQKRYNAKPGGLQGRKKAKAKAKK